MICRVCLKSENNTLYLFDNKGMETDIGQTVHQYFWFKLLPTDAISTVICIDCWSKIYDFHKFYETVQEAHAKLNSLCSVKQEIILPDATQSSQLEVVLDAKTELHLVNDNNDTTSNDLSICFDEDRDILHEPEVYLMPTACIDKVGQFENNALQDIEPDMNIHERNESKLKLQTFDSNLYQEESQQNAIRINEVAKQVRTKVGRAKRTSFKYEDLIKKHISMGCDLCTYVATDFRDLQKHFKSDHSDIKCAYVICCNRKLNKRCKLAEHAGKHENPDLFKCEKCGKIVSSSYNLRLHMLAKHPTQQQLKYACDQCPKKFSKKAFLRLHLPKHVPKHERRFICSECSIPRAFASKHLLDVHYGMRHKKATNVCHFCAKEIRDKQCFEKHVRSHVEETVIRIKCPRADCDRWLKDEANLKQHMRRHEDEGKAFVCEQCNKSCKNHRSLKSHVKYAHSNAVFSCDECQKTFKKAISLREHQAQHTGEQLYQCPFCTRTFKSNANMHSHKKKIHPLEWDVWRKTKRGSAQQLLNQQNVGKLFV